MLDARTRFGIARGMLRLTLLFVLFLAACGPSLPDLDARLSAEARSAPYPQLQPLGPMIDAASALEPSAAARAGMSLEARAADLRRRAAALRRMPL